MVTSLRSSDTVFGSLSPRRSSSRRSGDDDPVCRDRERTRLDILLVLAIADAGEVVVLVVAHVAQALGSAHGGPWIA